MHRQHKTHYDNTLSAISRTLTCSATESKHGKQFHIFAPTCEHVLTPHASFYDQRHPLLPFSRFTNSPATSHGETADRPTRHCKQFFEKHTASNQTRLCTTPHAPHFSRRSPSIPPNQRTRCKTQSSTIPRSQHKGSVQKASPHTANLTQLATSPQHLATSARDRVHLRISTTQSRCTTLTQQPHRHSTCRAAATAQFPCLLRQEQRTAEEFSTGGTAQQVHQGLAKTLPHTLQQPENKGVCRAATPATRQTPANTSQHTNIKTCSATTTQGHYTLRRPLPQQTYVVLSSTLQPSNHQHFSR